MYVGIFLFPTGIEIYLLCEEGMEINLWDSTVALVHLCTVQPLYLYKFYIMIHGLFGSTSHNFSDLALSLQ